MKELTRKELLNEAVDIAVPYRAQRYPNALNSIKEIAGFGTPDTGNQHQEGTVVIPVEFYSPGKKNYIPTYPLRTKIPSTVPKQIGPPVACIYDTLRKVFPEGRIQEGASDVFKLPDWDIRLEIKATHNALYAVHCGVVRDSCDIYTENDLIGWVSYIKDMIEDECLGEVASAMSEEGIQTTLGVGVMLAWQTLKGLSPEVSTLKLMARVKVSQDLLDRSISDIRFDGFCTCDFYIDWDGVPAHINSGCWIREEGTYSSNPKLYAYIRILQERLNFMDIQA